MAPLISWDFKYKVPIVDGKVVNPETGLVEEAGPGPSYLGPPAVDVIWHNMHGGSNFKTVRAQFTVTVDKISIEIANHVRDGVYSIVSVSASAYSFTILCMAETTQTEFGKALDRMRTNLYGHTEPPIPGEKQNDVSGSQSGK